MSEVQSGDFEQARFEQARYEQAKAALHLARAYHDGALLAARHKPHDPEVQRRAQDAVQQGKKAWKNYIQAITAEAHAPSVQPLPSALPHVPPSFREE